jgi:hypothetical protein
MKKTRLKELFARAAICATAYFVSGTAIAYETVVHEQITKAAVNNSLVQHDFVRDLGLPRSQSFNGNTPTDWIVQGSISEDDFPRSLHHFFDPTTQAGLLNIFGSAADWAVDASGNPTYSIPGARNSMYNALTSTNYFARENYWADTFRAVGQFTHLLQDMAQPQHVRNDPHLSFDEWSDVILPDFSRYERYTRYQVNSLNYGSAYPMVQLPSYRSYWQTGDGKGLAEFANSNFVSQNTNFGPNGDSYPSYPSPSFANSFPTDTKTFVLDMYGNTSSNVTVRYFGNTFTDRYNGGTVTNNHLTAASLFDFIHRQYNGQPVFTLTDDNNFEYAQILIPRAVGYSAGLINYFFRGNLQISLPDDGVYSIVDQSTITVSDASSNFTGFSKIKLKLSAPANGNDGQPQTLSGGTVIAVLKFHRNTCWKDDMSGEPPAVNFDGCRSPQEEIVVSGPANGGASIAVGSSAMPLEFNFGQQLPINAIDVRLQVVYRGTLGNGAGSDESNAVVVATTDISEPTFFSYMNVSDYYTIDKKDANGLLEAHTRSDINDPAQGLLQYVYPQSCVDYTLSPAQLKPGCLNPFNISLGLTVGTTSIDVAALPPKRLVRIAYLGDGTADTSLKQKSSNTCYPHDAFDVTPLTWELVSDPSGNILYYPDFDKLRDVQSWYGTSCIGSADSSPPGTDDNREKDGVMAPLDTSNKVPYPVQINGGSGF